MWTCLTWLPAQWVLALSLNAYIYHTHTIHYICTRTKRSKIAYARIVELYCASSDSAAWPCLLVAYENDFWYVWRNDEGQACLWNLSGQYNPPQHGMAVETYVMARYFLSMLAAEDVGFC